MSVSETNSKMDNSTKIINIRIQDILKKLPHRYPFILIDKITELNLAKNIVALKNVTSNEPCFQGHFPDKPVMPGVLMIESLAQASALLFIYSIEERAITNFAVPDNGMFLFAGINNVKFKKIVQPGDQLRLESAIVKYKKDMAKFSVQAFVDGDVVCSAELLSAYRNIDA